MRTMKYANGKVSGIKIGYIGGGSRGWAWGLMSDLASCGDISGEVRLYDIDRNAADSNEIIGNRFRNAPGTNSEWNYRAVDTLEQALAQADFVVISILPGTFDEMESDVHAPEAYGIYQSVGDTTGPGWDRACHAHSAHVRNHCESNSGTLPTGMGYQLHQSHDAVRKNAVP